MSFFEEYKFSNIDGSPFTPVNNFNEGIWEFNVVSKEVKYSSGFYNLLGYKPEEIEATNNYFFEYLLYHQDKPAFINSLNVKSNEYSDPIQIRLLTKSEGYRWFESTVIRYSDSSGQLIYGSILNIHHHKQTAIKSAKNDLLYDEVSKIAKLGNWELDTQTMGLFFSKQTYALYDLYSNVKLSLDEAVSFFHPLYINELYTAINNATNYCQPFDLELLLITAKNNEIWVRVKGLPIIDDEGVCVRIRGIMQNIDHNKRKSLELEANLKQLAEQNKRLQSFVYIVSHNLRSHTGNLNFMVNLFEEVNSAEDKKEIFDNIHSVSDSLVTTIDHLNQIVKIEAEIGTERQEVSFEDILNNTINAIDINIAESQAVICSDFSLCPTVNYIPAYLESIFLNLLTNAIKYKSPERTPQITCKSYLDNGHTYLTVADNGIGIDMAKYGDKVFGMYKTFHTNTNSKGIGLFITRNQIESLGGSIEISSTVNVGTTFTIMLM